MKRLLRALNNHFGVTAQRVVVRPQLPWYGRFALLALLFALGYGAGWWRYADKDAAALEQMMNQMRAEQQALQTRAVRAERQLQVEQASQESLKKEMVALQDEAMRLKEDVAFYKSILAEGGTAGVLKLHSIKLSKGARDNEYQYRILLVQSGRHDKMVQGGLRLLLTGVQEGKTVTQRVEPVASQPNGIKINFKYYQRIEGTFSIPPSMTGQSLQVQFVETGSAQPKLTQTVSLPA